MTVRRLVLALFLVPVVGLGALCIRLLFLDRQCAPKAGYLTHHMGAWGLECLDPSSKRIENCVCVDGGSP